VSLSGRVKLAVLGGTRMGRAPLVLICLAQEGSATSSQEATLSEPHHCSHPLGAADGPGRDLSVSHASFHAPSTLGKPERSLISETALSRASARGQRRSRSQCSKNIVRLGAGADVSTRAAGSWEETMRSVLSFSWSADPEHILASGLQDDYLDTHGRTVGARDRLQQQRQDVQHEPDDVADSSIVVRYPPASILWATDGDVDAFARWLVAGAGLPYIVFFSPVVARAVRIFPLGLGLQTACLLCWPSRASLSFLVCLMPHVSGSQVSGTTGLWCAPGTSH